MSSRAPLSSLLPRVCLVPLLSVLAAASPTQESQLDWTRGSGMDARVRAVEALPGGGAIVVTDLAPSGMGDVYAVNVERFDDRGDSRWLASTPVNFFGSVTYCVAVSTDGRTLLGICSLDELELRLFDGEGQLSWMRTLPAPQGRTFFRATAAFTSNGDMVIGAPLLDGAFAGVFGECLVERIGGSGGASIWSRVLTNRGDWRMKVDQMDGIHLLSIDGQQWTGPTVNANYRRLDPQGATAADESFDVIADGRNAVAAWHLAAGGEVSLLSTFTDHAAPRYRFTSIDPGGTVEWTLALAQGGFARSALLRGGDALLLYGDGQRVRVDRQGIPTIVPPDPLLSAGGLDLLALLDGGYAVRQNSTFGTVVRCAADDAVVWTQQLQLFANVWQPMVEGMSGRILLGAHEMDLFFEGDGHVVQIGELWNEPSVVACPQTAPNSTGVVGRVRAVGSDNAAENDLILRFFHLPPAQFLLPLASTEAGSVPGAGGSLGTLCLGGEIGRFPAVLQVTAIGTARLRLDLTAIPGPSAFRPVLAGQSWFFQGWHRDVGSGPVSNMTDGIRVDF